MARRLRSRSTASESGPADTASEAAAQAEACRFLARAPRSAAEVTAYLGAGGFASAAVAAALHVLRDLRYIDDAALARRRAEELLVRRGCGRIRVAHELTRRGVAASVVDAAIAAIFADRNDAELAREALRRKFGERPPITAAARARVFRFLTARGHPAEVVSEILGIEDHAERE